MSLTDDKVTRRPQVEPPKELHPLADIFPRLKDINPDGFQAFKEDIKSRGQQEPIITYEGKVLDGRNRYDACQELGITPQFREYTRDDPIGFVLSANLHRRHLNESQRAMVAAKLADLQVGANQHKEGTSIDVASKALNVGRASVDRAKVVLKSGDQALISEVQKGKTSVSKAEKQVKKPKPVSTSSTKADAAYEKAEKTLLDCLEDLAAEEAEAAATETIRNINKTVAVMLKAAEKAKPKEAA
jgi:hypothetical protein